MSDVIVDVSLIYSDDSENSKEFVYGERIGELVRCKDCINWWSEERQCKDEMGFARHWNADDYCSNGKRREE